MQILLSTLMKESLKSQARLFQMEGNNNLGFMSTWGINKIIEKKKNLE